VSDEVERIASNQRHGCGLSLGENAHVLAVHNFDGLYDVGVLALRRLNPNDIASPDVLQDTKEAVTVTGDRQIAFFSRHGGARYPAKTAIQRCIIRTLENRDRQSESRDAQDSEWEIRPDRKTFFVGFDPRRTPQTEVDSVGVGNADGNCFVV
jgi:hypothetical protein